MYWADKGNIFRSLRNSLYERVFLAPIIILIALFCNLNTHLLSATEPIVEYLWNLALEFCKEICRVRISTVKTGSVNRHTLIKGVKKCLPTLSTLLDNWDKIRCSTFPRNAVSYCRFHKFWCSKSPALFQGINKILPLLSTDLVWHEYNVVKEISIKKILNDSFVKIDVVETYLSWVVIKFLYVLPIFFPIWIKISIRDLQMILLHICDFQWESVQGSPYFSYARRWK
jgi:hypothetical protein